MFNFDFTKDPPFDNITQKYFVETIDFDHECKTYVVDCIGFDTFDEARNYNNTNDGRNWLYRNRRFKCLSK